CGRALPSSSANTKAKRFTINQEIGHNVSPIKADTKSETYWNENQQRLPQMATLVRHYNCIPANLIVLDAELNSLANGTVFHGDHP
ncbi:unnamed protein product, partial [Didymodactylos carnosus]